ncbi:hypothetical protein Glove_217g218 [Diversispora epigaea]|uniref:AAA-ATPase-like domain-containing protein n=1 Tax=Diversispora epigaea TaxID=1348612 RepID=A0A397IGQ9_9GLOM|nr:hypothetical protein Glove_217g218 [Diversispora epigaea]
MILWKVEIEETKENIEKFKILKLKLKENSEVLSYLQLVWLMKFFWINLQRNAFTLSCNFPPPLIGISRLGGLGGTNMKKTEDGLDYEGLDLTRIDNLCQRKETINKLLNELTKKRIILIRSPPMSGKTSFTQLLEYNILQSDEVNRGLKCVFRISLLWMARHGMKWTFAEGFKILMNMEWSKFIELCKHSDVKVIFIVDEVQLIYRPHNETKSRNGGDVFRDTFKDVNQYLTNFYIVAFASYGYYGAYTSYRDYSIMDISPPSILHEDNTWGFTDLRFTEEEFNDYFYRFCEMRLQMLKEKNIPFLHNYVREITAFHPGLVAFTIDKIYNKFVKQTSELEFGNVFAYLKSYGFYFNLKGIRTSPRVTDMSDEEKRIVDKLLFNKNLKLTPLFRVTYLQDLFDYNITRSTSPPKKFEDFIKLVFAKMNPKILQNSKGKGEDGQLFERVWQMEFYCALLKVLPGNIFLSVDVGKVFGSKEYVDFYINEMGKIESRSTKVSKIGIYDSILKHTKQWAIIDLRNSNKKVPELEKCKMNDIYVHCDENFESV